MYIQSNMFGIIHMNDVEYFERQTIDDDAYDAWYESQHGDDDDILDDDDVDTVDDGPVATGTIDEPVPF